MELYELGVTDLLAAYKSGEASPVEALDSCLARIDVVEPEVNAILTLCEERARAAAQDSAQRWLRGIPRPLEGVPLGLKDVIKTAGIRTTAGSTIHGSHVPSRSAAVATRLQLAGAVLVAKLQTMEFAMGSNSHYGPTRNPWNPGRVTGGSSCGSAVALAAGELPLTVGTDTAGSIRSPAAFCGLSGLKPTYGRVSCAGVMPLSWSLDHVGPMARSAADLKQALDVMSGPVPNDPYSIDFSAVQPPTMMKGVEGLRVAVPQNWFLDILSPAVEAGFHRVASILEASGVTLVECTLPHASLADTVAWVVLLAEMASLHSDLIGRIREYGKPMTQQLLIDAQFVRGDDYLRTLRTIPLIQRDFEAVFDQADAVLVPGMPTAAPRVDDVGYQVGTDHYDWEELVSRTTSIFNVTGIPALAVPSGFDDEGLPVGVQIASRPGWDEVCLRVGEALQLASPYHEVRPPLGEQSSRV